MNDYDQEIEEAWRDKCNTSNLYFSDADFCLFIAGAKWQQQKDAEKIEMLEQEIKRLEGVIRRQYRFMQNE